MGKIRVESLYNSGEPNSLSFYEYSYQPMIEASGKILVQVDDHDYQGDTRVLLEKNGKYGIMWFGWGSCSGCDALQACNNYEDLQRLFDGLTDEIKWFDDKASALHYIENHDWEGDYCWAQDETKYFIKLCKEILAP